MGNEVMNNENYDNGDDNDDGDDELPPLSASPFTVN